VPILAAGGDTTISIRSRSVDRRAPRRPRAMRKASRNEQIRSTNVRSAALMRRAQRRPERHRPDAASCRMRCTLTSCAVNDRLRAAVSCSRLRVPLRPRGNRHADDFKFVATSGDRPCRSATRSGMASRTNVR
jgi:hypothetical protein